MQVSILTGQSSLLDGHTASGINKQPILEPQFCGAEGLVADVQVSSSVHGGPGRAVRAARALGRGAAAPALSGARFRTRTSRA